MKNQKILKINNLSIITIPLILPFFLIIMITHVSGQAAWTSSGPPGGYVNSISFSPSDQGVVYAGTISGVYKSIDGGEQWSFAGLGGIEVNIVKVDPENAQLVYAGTDIENGFFKSLNGGEDWIQLADIEVLTMDIDPNDPKVLWIGTDCGRICKSSDRGDTGIEMHHEEYSSNSYSYDIPVNSIVIDPEDSSNIFAGLGVGHRYGFNGFAKSVDGGETWDFKHLSPLGPWDMAKSLIITPKGHIPQALYLIAKGEIIQEGERHYLDDVYVSTDKGETWNNVNVPVIGVFGPWDRRVQYKATSVWIDHQDPDWIYVGTTNPEYPFIALNISDMIGTADIGNGLPELAPTCMAGNPFKPLQVLAGYRNGTLYKSTDNAKNWEKSDRGIGNSVISDLSVHPQLPKTVYATIDGKFPVQKSDDGGVTWNAYSPGFSEDFSAIAIDPYNPDKMFVGTKEPGKIYQSDDSGGSWIQVDADVLSGGVKDLWIHPINPDTILALDEYRGSYKGGVRRSSDGGNTWDQVYNWRWPNCLTSDPTNHNHVYMGVERMGYVFYSPDAGSTWDNISPGDIWYNVNNIVVDSGSNLYAATTEYEDNEKDGIWKMEWKSETSYSWSHIYRFEDTQVTALAIDHRKDPAILYAGTSDSGVFVSDDGGESWVEFNDGLGITDITRLEISATEPKMLYAGTVHGGVWATPALSLPEYLISVVVEPEGEGTVTGDGTYFQGNSVTLTATPTTGYHFVHWTEDGEVVSDNPEYTFTAAEDRDLVAHFAINTYLVTATAGENGSISPAGDTEVEHGNELVFTIAPDEGYRIAFVMIDGSEIDLTSDENWDAATGQYTFSDVTEAHTIEVGFEVATDIAEAEALQRLTVYPNPAKEELWVAFDHQGDAAVDLVLLNVHGQVVQQVSISASGPVRHRMATHGLTPGVYLLTIRSGEVFPVKKVVIEN